MILNYEKPLDEADIISRWKEDDVKVSICCIVYNQEQFVEQTINSFLTQKTNFRFEILVHDDCSTDATQKILKRIARNYPNIITLILQKENQFSNCRIITPRFLFPLVKGEFVAMCEGDDFWIDPLKLQTQYDLLNCNPDIGICVHPANVVNYNNEGVDITVKQFSPLAGVSGTLPFRCFAFSHLQFAPTSSYFFRARLVDGLFEKIKNNYAGDLFIEIVCGSNGFLSINRPMSCYRLNTPGSYSSENMKQTSSRCMYKLEVSKQLNDFCNHLTDKNTILIVQRKADKYLLSYVKSCLKSGNVSWGFIMDFFSNFNKLRNLVR